MMVETLVSCWEGLFSGAMLNFWGVAILLKHPAVQHSWKVTETHPIGFNTKQSSFATIFLGASCFGKNTSLIHQQLAPAKMWGDGKVETTVDGSEIRREFHHHLGCQKNPGRSSSNQQYDVSFRESYKNHISQHSQRMLVKKRVTCTLLAGFAGSRGQAHTHVS